MLLKSPGFTAVALLPLARGFEYLPNGRFAQAIPDEHQNFLLAHSHGDEVRDISLFHISFFIIG
jgi:hypothetical protein